MSSSYRYIDPEFSYTDSDTNLLRNLQGITNADVLLFVESSAVTKRLQEFYEYPLIVKGVIIWFEIHQHLFQDLYSWAGKKRTVEISKDGKQFFPTSFFDNAVQYLDQLILEYKSIPKRNRRAVADKLAEILDHVNYLHPFREGNGRSQREFLRLLAFEKGYLLNLNPPDHKGIYDRYMLGTIESEVKILADLIDELLILSCG